MTAILFAFGSFALAMALHFALWQFHLPRAAVTVIVALFAAVFPAVLAVCAAWLDAFGLFEFLYGGLLYASMALCYLSLYTAIEADSPTLSLLHFLSTHGETGVTESGMQAFIASKPFVKNRLDQLTKSGFVREQGGHLVVAFPDSLLFTLFNAFRRVMGRESLGG